MHRLFVALRPPPAIRDELIDGMEGIEGARWQVDEQLHLTLRYIGEVDASLAEDVAGELARVVMPPFELAIRDVGFFERKGVPRAVWARIADSEPLRILQGRVERACRRAGCEPETRRFTPHITLARLNAYCGPVGGFLAANSGLQVCEWPVDAFALFESHLAPSGSDYQPVVRYSLCG